MNRLGKLIYTTEWDYQVYAVVMRDKNSKRVSVELYIVSDKGEMSDIITLTRRDIFRKRDFCDFLYDMDGDFTRDNIDCVKNAVVQIVKTNSGMEETQSRATIDEIHSALSDYIRLNKKGKASGDMFISGEYGYIRTACMDEFIKENKELGYKRIEILKRLKIAGFLENGKDRPYDILVSVDGLKQRYYKILLAEIGTEPEEDEVVSL